MRASARLREFQREHPVKHSEQEDRLAELDEVTLEEERTAMRVVAASAKNADDCRELLDALGLDPARVLEPTVRVAGDDRYEVWCRASESCGWPSCGCAARRTGKQ